MKKLALIAALLLSVGTAFAGGGHHGGHHGGIGYRHAPVYGGWGWVAPVIVTGAVVYTVTRPAPVVYIERPAVVIGPYAPPYGFHWEQILDANCNCYRVVLVQS